MGNTIDLLLIEKDNNSKSTTTSIAVLTIIYSIAVIVNHSIVASNFTLNNYTDNTDYQ